MSATRTRRRARGGGPGGEPRARELRRLRTEKASLRARVLEAETRRARLAALYDGAPVALLMLDDKTRILEANVGAARLFGVPDGSLVGASLATRVELGDIQIFIAHVQKALAGGNARACHVTFIRRTGGPFLGYVETRGEAVAGGGRRLRMVVSNAAERYLEERAHAARLERERAVRDAVEAAARRFAWVASLGALVSESLDLEDTAVRAARAPLPELASFCAIDVADAGGRVRRVASACADGQAAPPIDPHAPRGSAAVVRSGVPQIIPAPMHGDIAGLSVEPDDLPLLFRGVRSYLCLPLRARGRTLGAMTFVRSGAPPYTPEDVTVAEEMARHAASVIQAAQLYQAAQEADRRKDEFLAMLGHELRNPLAAIVLAAGRLRGACEPGAQKAADVVGRQSQRLTRLVDDLLDASRISRGEIALRRGPVPLGDVIASAVEAARPAVLSRHHEVSVHLPAEPLVVDGDAARLEQVLVNLLGNSARYTDPGGHIHVEAARESGEAVVRVRDDGIGMDRETMARIFEPFTRFAPSFDRGDRGLGIGLTLSRALVELHGGRLTAESAGPGLGSQLTVRLPAGPKPAERPDPAPSPPARSAAVGRPSRLLLVEDEVDVADMTLERLAGPGREVRLARDGVEAVNAALAFRPELLLVDLGLPGMSGYDVVRRLRREEALTGATFVALSGYGDEATRRRSLEAGFDCHLTKPLGEEALRRILGAG